MSTRQFVEFCITGTRISPDEITELLGVVPTRIWRLDEPIQDTMLRRKHNGWCLTKRHESAELADLVKSLLNELLPNAETITRICSDYELDCELCCVAYVINQAPAINFDREIIRGLAQLGATLDIDIILTE